MSLTLGHVWGMKAVPVFSGTRLSSGVGDQLAQVQLAQAGCQLCNSASLLLAPRTSGTLMKLEPHPQGGGPPPAAGPAGALYTLRIPAAKLSPLPSAPGIRNPQMGSASWIAKTSWLS